MVQEFLLRQLGKQDLQAGYCVNQVQLSGGTISIGKLANETGISQRQLLRRFQQYWVGFCTRGLPDNLAA